MLINFKFYRLLENIKQKIYEIWCRLSIITILLEYYQMRKPTFDLRKRTHSSNHSSSIIHQTIF